MSSVRLSFWCSKRSPKSYHGYLQIMKLQYLRARPKMVGCSEHFLFSQKSWECHHPNWRTHIVQRGGHLNHQPVKYWDHLFKTYIYPFPQKSTYIFILRIYHHMCIHPPEIIRNLSISTISSYPFHGIFSLRISHSRSSHGWFDLPPRRWSGLGHWRWVAAAACNAWHPFAPRFWWWCWEKNMINCPRFFLGII